MQFPAKIFKNTKWIEATRVSMCLCAGLCDGCGSC